MDIEQFRVTPGMAVDLNHWRTDEDLGFDKGGVKDTFDALNDELEQLQELLYAEAKHKVLVVIQATDTGGKDGTIEIWNVTNEDHESIDKIRDKHTATCSTGSIPPG